MIKIRLIKKGDHWSDILHIWEIINNLHVYIFHLFLIGFYPLN